jgi:hypothetical protein
MRDLRHLDRGQFWEPVPDFGTAVLRRDGLAARAVSGLGQVLVSGDLRAAAALAPEAPIVGLWDIAETPTFFLRMARDRALLVSPQPLAVRPGWRAEGFAASPADDAFTVLEIAGDDLASVVAEATGADLSVGSPSAAIRFCGVDALLCRSGPDTARLHVERAFAPYVWRWLETREG